MFKKVLGKLTAFFAPKSEEETLEKIYKREIPKEIRKTMERQTLKFEVAHGILMDRFGVIPSRAKSYAKLLAFRHKLLSEEEAINMRNIINSVDGRRQAFNLMVEMQDITPYMLNTCFPLGERRCQFERWLDGNLSQLP